jgi:predicted small lipoprotein YifL
MRKLKLLFSCLMLVMPALSLTACGHKGKLKTPSQAEAEEQKKERKEAKKAAEEKKAVEEKQPESQANGQAQ